MPDLVDRVRAAFAHLPDVEEKRMFGGVGFMVRGKLCIGARPERLMCRVDPDIHDRLIARAGCTTMLMKQRAYRGYVNVDGAVLKSARDLAFWIKLTLDYNERLTSPRP